MTPDELMEEACRLARESVENGWGGPFGAVIADEAGEIVARGQNRVIQTGDPTAHAEVECIRHAVEALGAEATLPVVPRPPDSHDPLPERARMLMGYELYVSGAPCPMCMSAIYWARLEKVRFASDLEATTEIGFDDSFHYEDFDRPFEERHIDIAQFRPDLGAEPYEAWVQKPDRHPY